MMNKDTKTLYDFIPNYPKGSTKPFIVKLGSKNTFDKISISKKDIISNLINVYDPEIPVNIYDLGLIYTIDINNENDVKIIMTLTAPGCPVAGEMPGWVSDAIEPIAGIRKVDVELIWEPPWGMDMMSDEAKLELGFM